MTFLGFYKYVMSSVNIGLLLPYFLLYLTALFRISNPISSRGGNYFIIKIYFIIYRSLYSLWGDIVVPLLNNLDMISFSSLNTCIVADLKVIANEQIVNSRFKLLSHVNLKHIK